MTEVLTALNTLLTDADYIKETANGGFNRETDSLEAIRDAIDSISLGGGSASAANQALILDGNAGDFVATEDSLHDIRSAIGRTIITGAANRRLEDTPYYIASPISIVGEPRVDHPNSIVAYQSFINSNGALPTTSEITPGNYTIDRLRPGTDADWTNIVASSALTEANGIVRISYTFPNASWIVGDMARVIFTGTSIVLGGKTVTIPDTVGFTQVFGIAIADSALNALPLHVIGNKADVLQTDGGASRSLVAHAKGALSILGHGTYGLSALNTLIAPMRDTADAGFNRETDSLEAIRDFLTTMNTTIDTINSSVGGGAGGDLDSIIALHAVPAGDAATNVNMRDVIGNKSDTIITDVTAFTNTSVARKLLTLQRTWKAVVPDTDVSLAAIDSALTLAPSGSNTPDAANTVLSLNFLTGSTYKLEGLTLFVSSFGTGTYCDIRLYLPVNGVVTLTKTIRVGSALSSTVDYVNSEYLSLADLFGLTAITADTIHLIAITDAGNTAALQATYSYSVARSS